MITYPKLKPEVKSKWLFDLRSGNYQQGKDALKATIEGEDTYCCLGVLAEGQGCKSNPILSSSRWEFKFDNVETNLKAGSINYPPYEWHEVIFGGHVTYDIWAKIMNILSRMNDVENKNFNEIADWIEENL